MFDLNQIAAANLVAQIDYHESIGSTSDRALELAATGDTNLPLLVLAARQTAGRGRGANRWHSTAGALTFSLVLEAPADRLPPARWPQVALITGLAVCQALEQLAPAADLRVKWPNDVYLAEKKIAGILSESVPGWRDRLIIGIGINVNNRVQKTQTQDPPFVASSLIEHDDIHRELTSTLLTVLDEFDRSWRHLLTEGFPPLAKTYRQRCFLTGKAITVQQPGNQTFSGRCLGIDDFGNLRLQTQYGEEMIASGTITGWETEL